MNLEELPHRKVRYWLFRFRTECDKGVSAAEAPEGLKIKFENLEWFQGWENFGISWDVHADDCFRIVPLKQSLDDDWNQILERVTIELVPDEKHVDRVIAAREKEEEVITKSKKKKSKKKAKKKSKKKVSK